MEEIRGSTRSPMTVPGRNLILLSLALALAEEIGASSVVFAPNRDDRAFPDCRPEFVDALRKTTPLQIVTPLIDWTKRHVAEVATEFGVPIGLTASCYQPMGVGLLGEVVHCGRCDACQIRRDAFIGLEDPTHYKVDL